MATTVVYSGSLKVQADARAAFSVDTLGGRSVQQLIEKLFAAAGGEAPTLSGFLRGTLAVSVGDILLAHATDPFQAMGDSAYSDGFTVAGSRLKLLLCENKDGTNSVQIARGSTNGLPIFVAAGDGVDVGPGGAFLWYHPTGTATLTTGSNDKLTLTPSAGSPSMEVVAFYGP